MKTNSICVMILLSFLFFSCKDRSTDANNSSAGTGLAGNWLWQYKINTFKGIVTYPADNIAYTLQITSDSTYIEKQNDSTTFSDRFTVVTDTTYHCSIVDFKTSRRFNLRISQLTADSLKLAEVITDGYIYAYAKVK